MQEGRGVKNYTKAEAVIDVYFPAGQVCCKYCPLFLKYEKYFNRYSCVLSGEWLLDPMNEVGESCPLKILKKEEE